MVADVTTATPILTQGLSFGADIVMHSATKGLNGHSDVLAGALSCADADSAMWRAIRADRDMAGAVLGPFEAWLLLRGMRTLPLRIERMSENAQKLAEYLSDHPSVETVLYPGLPSHAGHALAVEQMTGGFGPLLSFVVKGARRAHLMRLPSCDCFTVQPLSAGWKALLNIATRLNRILVSPRGCCACRSGLSTRAI